VDAEHDGPSHFIVCRPSRTMVLVTLNMSHIVGSYWVCARLKHSRTHLTYSNLHFFSLRTQQQPPNTHGFMAEETPHDAEIDHTGQVMNGVS
jgi:hypothetical protein